MTRHPSWFREVVFETPSFKSLTTSINISIGLSSVMCCSDGGVEMGGACFAKI